jgi:hypothetical protein
MEYLWLFLKMSLIYLMNKWDCDKKKISVTRRKGVAGAKARIQSC